MFCHTNNVVIVDIIILDIYFFIFTVATKLMNLMKQVIQSLQHFILWLR